MFRRFIGPVRALLALVALGWAADASAQEATHRVAAGNTLSRIAIRYCGSVDAYRAIARDNGIVDADRIYPGQVLTVRCPSGAPRMASLTAPRQLPATVSGVHSDLPKPLLRALNRGYTIAVVAPGAQAPTFIGPHAEQVKELYSKTVNYQAEGLNPKARELEEFACRMFGEDCAVYLAVTKAENDKRSCRGRSPFNPNGSFDTGFPQMTSNHVSRFPQFDFTDCREAIMASYILYRQDGGFTGWTKYNNGDYLRYLPQYRRFADRLRQSDALSAGEDD